MSTNRFRDFDAAWAEKKSDPLSVKVLGKRYNLPAKLPVKVVLILARLKASQTDPNADVPPETVIELLEPFFGKGTLEAWAERGMDTDQMGDVFKWAMAIYGGSDPDAKPDEDEEPDSPNS